MSRKSQWFEDYEVRAGGDGKLGIYLREYNVRLATFNANTTELSTRLKLLFNRSHTVEKHRMQGKRRRAKRDETLGGGAVTPSGGNNW